MAILVMALVTIAGRLLLGCSIACVAAVAMEGQELVRIARASLLDRAHGSSVTCRGTVVNRADIGLSEAEPRPFWASGSEHPGLPPALHLRWAG